MKSDRDYSVSPRDEYDYLNSTPPALLPTDLLASSPATNEAVAAQAYMEACNILDGGKRAKARGRRSNQKRKQKAVSTSEPEEGYSDVHIPLASSPPVPKAPPAAMSTPAVPTILENMFKAAQNTGGVIRASDLEPSKTPVFYAEVLEECLGDQKTTAATSETTIDKYARSGSSDSVPIYDTVYDNGQRLAVPFWNCV
jgi:hypothetical protein